VKFRQINEKVAYRSHFMSRYVPIGILSKRLLWKNQNGVATWTQWWKTLKMCLFVSTFFLCCYRYTVTHF